MATIQDYQKQLAELYLAFFDRAPDASGMAFWVGHLVSGALTLEAIAKDWWETQAETKAKYPAGLSTSEFVERIYQNVLGRDSDKDGKAFWVKDLDAGKISRDTFIQEIIKGAKAETGGETDRAYLANRTEVSLELLRHDDVIDRDSMAKILKSVDSSKESLQTAKDKVETMSATHNHSSDENVLIVLAKNLIANPDSYADGSIGLLAGVEKNQLSIINNASDKLAPNAIKSIPEAAKNDGGLENLIKAGKVADGAVAKLTGVTNANLEKVVEIMSKLKDGAVQDDIANVQVADIDKITTLGDKVKDGAVMMRADQITDDNIEAIASIASKIAGSSITNVTLNVSKLESIKALAGAITDKNLTLQGVINSDNIDAVAGVEKKLQDNTIATQGMNLNVSKLDSIKALARVITDGKITLEGEINSENIEAVAGVTDELKDDSITNEITIDVSKVASIKALAAAVTDNKVILMGEINKDNVKAIAEIKDELKDDSITEIKELAAGTDFTEVKKIEEALANNAIQKIGSVEFGFANISENKIADGAVETLTGVTAANIAQVEQIKNKLQKDALKAISFDDAAHIDQLKAIMDKVADGAVVINKAKVTNGNINTLKQISSKIKDGGITTLEVSQTDWKAHQADLASKINSESTLEITGVSEDFAATASKDNIKLSMNANNINITGFAKGDKMNFRGIDPAIVSSEKIDVLGVSGTAMLSSKVYVLSKTAATGISDVASLHSTLFGVDKHFATNVALPQKAIIVADKQIYALDNSKGQNNNVEVADITLLGTVNVSLGIDDIA